MTMYSIISLCARAHYLRDVEGKHQGHRLAFRNSNSLLEK